jgi:hypothetical protein
MALLATSAATRVPPALSDDERFAATLSDNGATLIPDLARWLD